MSAMARLVPVRKLVARPLRIGERGALAHALRKAGLPADDLDEAGRLFFRFETAEEAPVGFGGLEIAGEHALLRSVVTLPPLRRSGFGRAIVAALESEAALHRCGDVYLLTGAAVEFFERLGYRKCEREEVPEGIRATREFAALCPASADVLMKRIS
jgi:N-acetylglutamate synthase-like GNAT family acetyltransferase